MRPPLSLRIARLLLVAAGAFAAGLLVYIAAASSDPAGAWPWLALIALNAGGFVAAALLLEREPRTAKPLAVASALMMAALGTITGFGAGMLSFPAAGIGALGAWAALLHPPRRRMVIAFSAYLAVGIATIGPALAFPLLWATALIWPARLLLFPGTSIVPIYALLGVAGSIAVAAFVRRRPFTPRVRPLVWALVFGIAAIAGVVATIVFQTVALLRTDTSARFELDQIVLALVFLGGALAAVGILTLYLRPTAVSAIALGLGAAALFMTFTYRPAITCEPNGTSQGLPLAWALRAPLEQRGGGFSSSGSSGTIGANAPNAPSVSTGRMQSGGREIVFRCEGDRLVEYREVAR